MYVNKKWLVGSVALWGLLSITLVHAGGPLFFSNSNGVPFRRFEINAQGQQVFRATFFVELGDLGTVPNQTPDKTGAADRARAAFSTWADTATADIQIQELLAVAPERQALFLKNITGADFAPVDCDALGGSTVRIANFECELVRQCVINNFTNCPSPVIFDSDGSILDTFGIGASTIGLTRIPLALFFPSPQSPIDVSIPLAEIIINGRFFDGNPETPDNPKTPGPDSSIDDPDGSRFLSGVITHEIGHFFGLAHSVVNGDQAAFNPAVQNASTDTRGSLENSNPVDSLTSVPVQQTETMFPLSLVRRDDQKSFLDTLHKDDEVALSTLYPCTTEGQAAARAAGRKGCMQEFSSSTGTISGSVFIPVDSALKRAQGVVVVARRVDDPNVSDSALTVAVSQLTGATFAPRRCFASLDLDGDGQINISGLFGACETPARISSECSNRFPNAVGSTQCGFFSFNFGSAPRTIPSAAENFYELRGLPPGDYIVQAIQPVVGGFSSPVRSSFNPLTAIRSDDDNFLTFFPNPQTGEFYNGPAQGCNAADETACLDANGNPSGESASSADNPFAFTLIRVTANERITHVNIFLNTGDTNNFVDPGFDYCGLGDVNGDGKVDDSDIFTVVAAKADFDNKRTVNTKADLNGDQKITFADIDTITDIVTIPRFLLTTPASNPISSQEGIRGLAPFQAVCASARGKCQVQAPVEDMRFDEASDSFQPLPELCELAKRPDLGCQVIGCP